MADRKTIIELVEQSMIELVGVVQVTRAEAFHPNHPRKGTWYVYDPRSGKYLHRDGTWHGSCAFDSYFDSQQDVAVVLMKAAAIGDFSFGEDGE